MKCLVKHFCYLIVYPFPSIQTENALANLSFNSCSAEDAPSAACCVCAFACFFDCLRPATPPAIAPTAAPSPASPLTDPTAAPTAAPFAAPLTAAPFGAASTGAACTCGRFNISIPDCSFAHL